MLRKLKRYHSFGIVLVVALGILLHFLYQWSSKNPVVATISPVNESVWEHLKMFFIPYLIYSIIQFFVLREHFPNVIGSNTIGVIVGILATIIVYYTYSGIIGKSNGLVDILIFVGSIYLSFMVSGFLMKNRYGRNTYYQIIGVLIFIILLVLFILFTYFPIHINLFRDPVEGTYGLRK